MPAEAMRDLPDDLYQRLAVRARRELLKRIAVEAERASDVPAITPPETLIREDRER
jgi:hypothetical protein